MDRPISACMAEKSRTASVESAERGEDVVGERGAAGFRERLQPYLNHRSASLGGPGQRMEHGLDDDAGLPELAHHTVDEERCIGLHDLQDIAAERTIALSDRRNDAGRHAGWGSRSDRRARSRPGRGRGRGWDTPGNSSGR